MTARAALIDEAVRGVLRAIAKPAIALANLERFGEAASTARWVRENFRHLCGCHICKGIS